MWWTENLALEGIIGKILLTLLSSAGPHPKSGHKLLSQQKAENSPPLPEINLKRLIGEKRGQMKSMPIIFKKYP